MLGKVAQLAVPVIALMLCYILSVVLDTPPAPVTETLNGMETGVAVSSVVGTIIVLVATLPDFGSFVHNRKHALITAALTFMVAYPLLFWAGAPRATSRGKAPYWEQWHRSAQRYPRLCCWSLPA